MNHKTLKISACFQVIELKTIFSNGLQTFVSIFTSSATNVQVGMDETLFPSKTLRAKESIIQIVHGHRSAWHAHQEHCTMGFVKIMWINRDDRYRMHHTSPLVYRMHQTHQLSNTRWETSSLVPLWNARVLQNYVCQMEHRFLQPFKYWSRSLQ